MMWYGGGWGGWIMMTVLMVLFWGGLLTAIVLAARAFGADSQARSRPTLPRADELLSDRLARRRDRRRGVPAAHGTAARAPLSPTVSGDDEQQLRSTTGAP